jgi:hypothetical protein
MRTVIGGALAASLLCSPVFAQTQSPSSAWNGLPDRFRVDTGYFHLNANTVLRYNGPEGGQGQVDFEQDLDLPQSVNTFWVDGTWRVGRRHQLQLGFTRLSRTQGGVTLERDFTWGGDTYNAGLTASSTMSSDILGGYYRFAILRNDQFEIGPVLGVGYLWLDARIQATGSVGDVSRTLDRSASTGSITGAIGGYAYAWPIERLVLRGDFLYIKVKPENSEASVTDWRLAADYYFAHHVGIGVQYKYNRYSYDRGILVSQLGGELTFKGFQVFLSFLF